SRPHGYLRLQSRRAAGPGYRPDPPRVDGPALLESADRTLAGGPLPLVAQLVPADASPPARTPDAPDGGIHRLSWRSVRRLLPRPALPFPAGAAGTVIRD